MFSPTVIEPNRAPDWKAIPIRWRKSASSRSGAPEKTDLSLESDVVRVGLIKGRLHCQIAEGLEFAADIRPSFDTSVMLSVALAAGIYNPALIASWPTHGIAVE